MSFKPVILASDVLLYLLVFLLLYVVIAATRSYQSKRAWKKVFCNNLGLLSFMVLIVYFSVALLDSIHFSVALPATPNGKVHYSREIKSVLDYLLSPLGEHHEKTYSKPFATHLYSKDFVVQSDGQEVRDYPRLTYGGSHLKNTNISKSRDVEIRLMSALFKAAVLWIGLSLLLLFVFSKRRKLKLRALLFKQERSKHAISWRMAWIAVGVIISLLFVFYEFSLNYHVLGTDKVGNDVFYVALKSVRTGLLIGSLTTMIMLPFALLFGMMAGFFGGVIDDIIQYIYTTLSSIPSVLLIAASILSIQIYVENHPSHFQTLASRADARLIALCIILGVTSWTSLCRVLRAETLKLREMDYVQAARALGSRWHVILYKHILPNIMHIVLISIVLDFSSLVLAEAVLTYVGVGVDPTTMSWGNMIDAARLELAREPVVWWPLLAAFSFMFIFILAANLFADAVRDGFDPRYVR